MSAKEKSIQDPKNKSVHQIIYGDDARFNYVDFENLVQNENYDQFEVGKLKVTSGKIVCTDPLYRQLGFPQTWEVENGEYTVNLYIGLEDNFEERVAYAELVFSNEEITTWEFSLIDEENLEDDFEKQLNGMYPVENGLGSFSDASTWKKYDKYVASYQKKSKESNFYNDILAPLFKANDGIPQSSRGEDWVNYINEEIEGNIIMFGSGFGDGIYPRYIGFDKDMKPVKMIADFIQMDRE